MLNIHNLSNYRFAKRKTILRKDYTLFQRLKRTKYKFFKSRITKSFDLVFTFKNTYHIYLLLIKKIIKKFELINYSFTTKINIMKLNKCIKTLMKCPNSKYLGVFSIICIYWRYNFESWFFPYLMPHLRIPKEVKYQIIVQLPSEGILNIPKNCFISLFPLYKVYKNYRFGRIIADLPLLVSKYISTKRRIKHIKKHVY